MRSAGTAARPGRIDLGRIDEALRAREDRGQLHLGLHPAVVVLAARARRAVPSIERWRTPLRNGKVAQLGELGADLTGVGVDRVAAGEHEVERAVVCERGRERLRGGERVGTGERGVGDEHAVDVDVAVEAPRDRFAQRVLGGRRPERDDGDVRARARRRELDGLTHRAPAVRVELEVDAVAPEPPVGAELHLLELRDLLHQNGDPHRPRILTVRTPRVAREPAQRRASCSR